MSQRESEVSAEVVPGQVSQEQEQVEQPTEQPVVLPPPTKKGKGKGKKAAEEEAWSAVGEYFATKRSATPSPVPPTKVDDEDDSFCKMLADELRKVKNASIKRQTKRQLLDIVYCAQEQDEQQTVQVIQWPSVIPAIPSAVPLPAPGNDGQVLVQLQQQLQHQDIPAATGDAELLLQLQQPHYQQPQQE